MLSLESIKVMLIVAGVSRLKIDFDDMRECVNVEYVFRGGLHGKQITYQEIIDSLTIGKSEDELPKFSDVIGILKDESPEPSRCPTAASDSPLLDESNQLT